MNADVRGKRVPLLIKIAPDLTEEEKADIAAVALRTKIDGLIVSNTTISRPDSLKVSVCGCGVEETAEGWTDARTDRRDCVWRGWM